MGALHNSICAALRPLASSRTVPELRGLSEIDGDTWPSMDAKSDSYRHGSPSTDHCQAESTTTGAHTQDAITIPTMTTTNHPARIEARAELHSRTGRFSA